MLRALLFFTFFQAATFSLIGAEQLRFSTDARSAILINAKTGQVLYEKKPDLKWYPGSTVKVATAAFFLEKWGESRLDQIITPDRDCLVSVPMHVRKKDPSCPSYRLTLDGTIMGIKFDEQLTARTLLEGMLAVSGNDAANVLAHACSGSVPQFMEELNAFLKSKGLTNTHFNNPHGYHHPEHVSTARDMATIARIAMQSEVFRNIVRLKKFERPETNKQPAITLAQGNKLIRNGPYYYAKATGIKTGHTDAGRNCFITSAEEGDRSLIAVLFGCPERRQMFRDAVRLFETAFSEKKVTRTLFAKGYNQFTLEVKGAKNPLQADLVEDLAISYYPSEEPEIQATVSWNPVEVPIKVGDVVGEVKLVTQEGQVLKNGYLIAQKDVEQTFWHAFSEWRQHWRLEITAGILLLVVSLGAWRVMKPAPRRGR